MEDAGRDEIWEAGWVEVKMKLLFPRMWSNQEMARGRQYTSLRQGMDVELKVCILSRLMMHWIIKAQKLAHI